MNINQFHDGETLRQQRNLTVPQRKTNAYLKEGVLVNNFIKDNNQNAVNLDETYDTLVISQNVKMPEKLHEDMKPKERSLLPISAACVGVMTGVTLLTAFIRRNARINMESAVKKVEKLPTTTRNVAINEETHQAIYRMIRNPTPKTILAGSGVLALTAMAFMGKTFFDGYKDVWVKKKEADIQKNLQEKLVDVETQSFGGKIQIIRSMLSDKAGELGKYVSTDYNKFRKYPKVFAGITFGNEKPKNETTSSHFSYFLLGAGTVAAILGLGFLAMKNLNAGRKHINNYFEKQKEVLKNIINTSKEETKANDKITLKGLFHEIDAPKDYIEESLKKLNWNKEEVEDFTKEVLKSTAKVNEAMGGDGSDKTTFYSHVNDYRAHLFNYLLNTDNEQFKQLFFGITGLTAFSYGGKLAGEAIKEVEVKKINAETELNLQKRLVSTELRNFKSKKDAAIQPLVDEFYRQVQAGKPKEELKVIADNILFEIKNGPPFVYS